MKDEVRVVTRRAGGKWEGIGTLLIVAGMLFFAFGGIGFGSLLMLVGLVVFIVGRCM